MKFRNYIDPGLPRENRKTTKNIKKLKQHEKQDKPENLEKIGKPKKTGKQKNSKTEDHIQGSKVSGPASKGMGARGERSSFQWYGSPG